MTKARNYGGWKSPVTSTLLTHRTVAFSDLRVLPTSDGHKLFWAELRPENGGRVNICSRSPHRDLLPEASSARTRVHEYGGLAYTVRNNSLIYSEFTDQRIYSVPLANSATPPTPVTPETSGKRRFADFSKCVEGIVAAVSEEHSEDGVTNSLCLLIDDDIRPLFPAGTENLPGAGHDFYSYPRLSELGNQLAFVAWSHPNMPWDTTSLYVADIDPDASISNCRLVSRGADESVVEPLWTPSGDLLFVSDRSGYWNLHRWSPSDGSVSSVWEVRCDLVSPLWRLGRQSYCLVNDTTIACAAGHGEKAIHLVSLDANNVEVLPTEFTAFSSLQSIGNTLYFIAESPTRLQCIAKADLATKHVSVVKESAPLGFDRKYISVPTHIKFDTGDDNASRACAYAFLYLPHNPDVESDASADELPPLLVRAHGGPTSAASSSLKLGIQFWTSRGFCVLDVNYRGSSGYGREYRQSLRRMWGVFDVQDVASGALHLIQQGRVDKSRIAIDGASAGGYTTLATLAFRDTFSAGCSFYGVSDLEMLARETHKFESRYLDSLIGEYPKEQAVYKARSPIHHADKLSCPLILFQGLQDAVVPPNQAELMFESVKARGIPVAHITYAEEQHGFRISENIRDSIEAELYFFSRVFGFTPADALKPVTIFNT